MNADAYGTPDKVNMDELRRLHQRATQGGRRSGYFVQFASEIFDKFELLYTTAKGIQRLADITRRIEQLRERDGSSVTLLADVPKLVLTGSACSIEVRDEWTGWEAKRFFAADIEQALDAALEARRHARNLVHFEAREAAIAALQESDQA